MHLNRSLARVPSLTLQRAGCCAARHAPYRVGTHPGQHAAPDLVRTSHNTRPLSTLHSHSIAMLPPSRNYRRLSLQPHMPHAHAHPHDRELVRARWIFWRLTRDIVQVKAHLPLPAAVVVDRYLREHTQSMHPRGISCAEGDLALGARGRPLRIMTHQGARARRGGGRGGRVVGGRSAWCRRWARRVRERRWAPILALPGVAPLEEIKGLPPIVSQVLLVLPELRCAGRPRGKRMLPLHVHVQHHRLLAVVPASGGGKQCDDPRCRDPGSGMVPLLQPACTTLLRKAISS